MKEQFLNLSGLTDLVTYMKLCIAQHKVIIPRASFSLFPETGDENNIYIDTSTNAIYRWNDTDKKFVLLAKPPRTIAISEGTNNGEITLKVDNIASNAKVHGLTSTAFTESNKFATAAQGAKADSAVQTITLSSGTKNGTIKIKVNNITTDNIEVAGLGSAAFSDIGIFAAKSHTHKKDEVGLGNVDNTADINKSVKYATSAGAVLWKNITDKPTLFPPQQHNHDSLYYRKNEVDSLLSGKSDTGHTHVQFIQEVKFSNGTYSDPLNGTAVAIKASGGIASDLIYEGGKTLADKYQAKGSYAAASHKQAYTSGECTTYNADDNTMGVTPAAVKKAFGIFGPKAHTHKKSDITDFPTSLPASDVYAWAKASSKPSYSWGEITGKPSTFTPSSHTHDYITSSYRLTAGTTANRASGIRQYEIYNNGYPFTYGNVLQLTGSNGVSQIAMQWHGTGLAYRSAPDTSTTFSGWATILTSSNYSSYTVTKTGGGASGTWGINVTGSAGSVAWGNVSGRPSSLPASDVPAWAKASTKPSYSWSEIGSKPSTFTPSSHTHNYLAIYGSRPADINFKTSTNGAGAMFHFVATSSTKTGKPPEDSNVLQMNWDNNGGWDTQFAISNGSSPHSYIRSQNNGTWGNWTTLLDSSNYNNYSPSKTGTGASGTWGINITGASGSCTGNAATASNASKVNGHTVNSDVPSGAKFTDTNTWRPLGTAANTACAGNDSRLSNSRPASDVYSWAKASSKPSYSWSEITSKPSTFTPASHTHAYIPLSGGTITGSIIRSSGGSWISARNNVAVRGTATGKDSWNPVVGQATPNGYWTIGNLASNDNLAFSYTSNTNYNAGNNSATTVYLPVQEGTIITSATIGSQSVKYATSAGSAGSVAWGNVSGKPSSYTPSSHTHDDRYYTETEINTKLGTKLGAVSANGYYGMARPDGNTSDWIRTTTAGIIPYQSGGAGGGHCGLGTSSWYFSNAYIDTVNCVNASVSGHIDVGGYIQSSNLINTYFEYQSNRGSVDWRFGAATGTGDENFFGFYDAKTGKIPLALDGNFGNIYVGFNVGGLNQKTAVGVYLGAQVSGNRAFIYHGDSYAGSIWIQTRLDGSWKWFSLGRACSAALSDIRLKGDIRDAEVQDATKVIEAMQIHSFERKDSHKKYKIGFIADELEQLDPNLVDGGGEVDGHPYYKSVNNLQLLAYVVKAMQELNQRVDKLEKENEEL